jgi:hypothetical protein
MPPLYGEGQNAFIRLQLEILTKLDDDSIFAWKGPVPWGYSGLLAPSPNNFFPSSNITKAKVDPNRPPHVMTSKGLAVQFAHRVDGSSCLALLNCAWDLGQAVESPVAVGLPLYLSDTDGTWRRGPNFLPFQVGFDTRLLNNGLSERQIFYVPQVSAQVETAFGSIRIVWRSSSGIESEAVDTWVQDLMRPTPINLGWRTGDENLGLYIFKCPKAKEPYFELKDHWTPTDQTPTIVYLDEPMYASVNLY